MLLGVDAGGSHTRAALVAPDGAVLCTGRAEGANPITHGVEHAAEQLRAALRQAIGTYPPEQVTGCVIGLAGGPTSGAPLLAAVDRMARELGLLCDRVVVSDAEVAFAAGSDAKDGILLIAGTGAAAAEIRNGRAVRHVDGHGWLLGDEGSGYWLGRETVRAVLALLDGRGRPTALADALSQALDVPVDVEALRMAVYGHPPIRLAKLAPLVTDAAAAGDPVAVDLVERAAELLLDAVAALDPVAGGHREAVLTGGVLLSGGILTERVTSGLRDRLGLTVSHAHDGALGAAKLAAVLTRELP
jgi:N-acetylglucosamine kinase-like BadF-type ATPase